MVTIAEIGTTLWQIVLDYFLIIIAVLVIGSFIIIDKIKKKRQEKKMIEMAKKIPQEEKPKQPRRPETTEDIFNMNPFQEGPSNKDVVERIKSLSGDINKEGKQMDNKLREDFEKLRQELKSTHERREEIRKHNAQLKELFEKLRQRELHVAQQMSNIEYMLQQKEQKGNLYKE